MKLNLTSLLFACLTFHSFKLSAQNTLEGTTFLYKDKGSNTPLSEVYIKAPYGGSITTNAKGLYNLSFDNSANIIALSVRKTGYEIINDDELKELNLTKKKQQNIYLDIEGNTEKRKRELVDASVAQAKKLRDSYYTILDKGGKEADLLRLKLEKQAAKKFADFEEVRTYIYDKFGADSKTIESVVISIIKQNLDHANKEVEKIKEYTLKGEIDSALLLLNIEQSFKKVKQNQNIIKAATNDNNKEKEKFLSAIPLLLANGYYSKIDSSYQLIIEIDTNDIDSYFKYASFLQNQNQFIKAIDFYKTCLDKVDKKNETLLASTLNNLGTLFSDVNDIPEAKKNYEGALEIKRRLATKKPDIYEPSLAATLNNLGLLLSDVNDIVGSKKNYEEAFEIYRKYATKDPNLYEPDKAKTLINIGNLLNRNNHEEEAKKNYEEALQIYKKLASKNTELYMPFIALILNNLGGLLDKINDKSEAKKNYEEALEIYRQFASKNYDLYIPYVALTLNNLGNSLDELDDKAEAKKKYEEALEISRRLAAKNPAVYESNVARILNDLGVLLDQTNDQMEAEKDYEEALEVYRRLEIKNPDKYESDVATILHNLGFLKNRINDKIGAKKNYEEALEIRSRLAAKIPEYEGDFAATLNNIGILLSNMGDRIGARKNFEKALEIRKRLAAKNLAKYQIDVALTLENLGILLDSANDKAAAIKYYKEELEVFISIQYMKSNEIVTYNKILQTSNYLADSYVKICKKDSAYKYYNLALTYVNSIIGILQITPENNKNVTALFYLSSYEGNASWYALHAKEYTEAKQYAIKALETDASQHWVKTNLAHALLLSGNYDEAEKIYIALIARPYVQDSTKTYTQVLLEDFQSLECSGAIPPERKGDVEKIKEMLLKKD